MNSSQIHLSLAHSVHSLLSHSHLPKPFCITSKSSHSRWYHASAPHPYISLLTIIDFHPSLSITYLLPDRIVIPKYLYSSTSPIQQSPIIHLRLPTLSFMHTTLYFFSLTFNQFFPHLIF